MESDSTLLGAFRVVELIGDRCFLSGRILGDFGADVVAIEKPGGSGARRVGPFYKDIPDPEKSLHWLSHNTSKRGITLDLDSRLGGLLFRELARKADVVLDYLPATYLKDRRLDYSVLSRDNPGLVMCSIAPFGDCGPHSGYQGSDLIALATGGIMSVTGDSDRPPLRMSPPQAEMQTGAHAAIGALIALYSREATGEGQYISTSMQESMARTLMAEYSMWEYGGFAMHRSGTSGSRFKIRAREIWTCRDGQIQFRLMSGQYGDEMVRLTQWMDGEGMAGLLKDVNWMAVTMNKVTQDQIDAWEPVVARFFMTHTKDEIYSESLKRQVSIMPVNSIEDVINSEQLRARRFFVDVRQPGIGKITYPGAPCLLSETPWKISRHAPAVGEHNEEVYGKELGLSGEELRGLRECGVI